MVEQTQTYSKESFDIGRIMNRAFMALRRNFKAFFIASLILVGLPYFIFSVGTGLFVAGQMGNGIDDITPGMIGLMGGIGFISMVLLFLAGSILQGAVTHTSINDFNDEQTSAKESISTGISLALPLIGLGIISGIAMVFGFLLLIVPGVFLACLWAVAAPALVVERIGIFDSLKRSADLTSGYRWWVLLLFIIIVALSMGLSMVSGILTFPVTLSGSTMWAGNFGVGALYSVIVETAAQVITTLIGTIVVASLYFELRYLKEGVGAESLASVFD